MYTLSQKFVDSLIEHNSKQKSLEIFTECISKYGNVCLDSIFSGGYLKMINEKMKFRTSQQQLELFNYIWYFSKHKVKSFYNNYGELEPLIVELIKKKGNIEEFVARWAIDLFRSEVLKEGLKRLERNFDQRLVDDLVSYIPSRHGYTCYNELFEIKLEIIKREFNNKFLFNSIIDDLRREELSQVNKFISWIKNDVNPFFIGLFFILYWNSDLLTNVYDELWELKDIKISIESYKRVCEIGFRLTEKTNWTRVTELNQLNGFEKLLAGIIATKDKPDDFKNVWKHWLKNKQK